MKARKIIPKPFQFEIFDAAVKRQELRPVVFPVRRAPCVLSLIFHAFPIRRTIQRKSPYA